MRNIALKYVEAINTKNLAAMESLMTDDFIFRDTYDNTVSGRTAMMPGWSGYFEWFPDYLIEVDEIMENNHALVLWGHASGTYRRQITADNRHYWRIPAAWKVIVRDGRIALWQVISDSKKPYDAMAKEHVWLSWARQLQSIAQAGLYYSNDVYAQERFEQVREISAEILSYQSEIPLDKVKNLFCNETGYQTPKLDTRAAIFRDNRILLVKENDGTWSLPGGWVDVDCSVRENIIKEVREEAGLDVIPERVIAVQDREKHNLPIYAYRVCKIFIQCRIVGGGFKANIETTESDFFARDQLPELATEKNNAGQIGMCFDAYYHKHWVTEFD